MKKLLFCILFLPLLTVAQTAEQIEAKKIKSIIDNRPNPSLFSEEDAWAVLTGEKSTSNRYVINAPNYQYLHLMKQPYQRTEWHYRANDGTWWYTGMGDLIVGEWGVNWLLVILLVTALIIGYFANRKLIERFTTRRACLVVKSSTTIDKEFLASRTSAEAKNEIVMQPILAMCLLLFAALFCAGKKGDFDLYVMIGPVLILWLLSFGVYLRLTYYIRHEQKNSKVPSATV